MGAAKLVSHCVTSEQYLADELRRDHKCEYVAGSVYPMGGSARNTAGTSNAHTRITGNINAALIGQLRGRRCEPFSTDTKVGIRKGEAQFYYYPDVVVDCGDSPDDSFFAEESRVISEVLSKETERTDRSEKRENYQSLPSLDVYVLVDQYQVAVTVYRRAGDDWTTELLANPDGELLLPTVECSLPVATIYERTRLLD